MEPNFDFVKNQQDALSKKYAENKENLIKKYHKYRNYFDRKANVSPLKNISTVSYLIQKTDITKRFCCKIFADLATVVQSRKSLHHVKLLDS